MEQLYREVEFNKYCETCKHKKKSEPDSPCDECLAEPTNLYTSKPVRWEEQK